MRPHEVRGLASDRRPPVLTEHKEFSDVGGVDSLGTERSALDENEPGDAAGNPNEKGKSPIALSPVRIELRITKTSIGAKCNICEHWTEIVYIKF